MLGRAELFAAKGEFRLRALSLERFGLGAHLAAIERLKQALAAEGLFDAARKRPLPRFPRRIGLVTGSDAAARRDVITTIQTRFPPARVLVAETLVQGPRAAAGIVEALRGGRPRAGDRRHHSHEGRRQLRRPPPLQRRAVVRAVASCPVPVVSAVGHEQDTPLCDLAADVRASTPTAAGKLVVPDFEALRVELDRARSSLERCVRRTIAREREGLARTRTALERGARRTLERDHQRLTLLGDRLRRGPDAPRRAAAVGARAGRRPPRRPLAARDARARLRDRPRRGRGPAQRRRGRARRPRARSSSPRAASTRGSRTYASERIDLRERRSRSSSRSWSGSSVATPASTRRSSSGSAARSCCASASHGSSRPRGRSRSSPSARADAAPLPPESEAR